MAGDTSNFEAAPKAGTMDAEVDPLGSASPDCPTMGSAHTRTARRLLPLRKNQSLDNEAGLISEYLTEKIVNSESLMKETATTYLLDSPLNGQNASSVHKS